MFYPLKKTFQAFSLTAGMMALASPAQAVIALIDFSTDTGNGTTNGTGNQLDQGTIIATGLPLTVDVYDTAPGDLGVVGATGVLITGLSLTAESASSFDSANTTLNAAGSTFGLNSPTPVGGSENASRFDVDASEVVTFSFNQAVTIISAEFGSFNTEETFTLGGVTFGNSQYTGGDLALADSGDVFTFAGGGLVLAADEFFSLQAGGPTGASVGLVALTIDFTPVPEPSSTALLVLGGLALIMRRRK